MITERVLESLLIGMLAVIVISAIVVAFGNDTKLYLHQGATQMICAPYRVNGEPAWSCVETAAVIRLILKDPPDCGH